MLYLQYSGFPHSEITGSQLICNSPMLIAAYRVLRRQSVPGHPPCALISLILFGRSYWLLRADMSALNVCRSVAALHTSSPTRFLRFPFCFLRSPFRLSASVPSLSASALSLSAFVSFSVSRKVFIAYCFFLCSFQGACYFPLLESGGLKWTRTTDLSLIRRVL